MNSPASSCAIPSIDRCLAMMEEFAMYANIRRHSFMVARVAEILHRGLEEAPDVAVVPERNLVIAGALLHDIAKTRCLQEGCRHAEVGRDICMALGLPEVAGIVADHVILSSFREEEYSQGIFSATELVFYADKRVNHDRVVHLEDRLAYIIDKYANNEAVREDHIRRNFEQCRRVEAHLFAKLPFTPRDLPGLLATSPQDLLHHLPEEDAIFRLATSGRQRDNTV